MKLLPKLILALTAVASCAVAGAQSVGTGQADSARRDRNREEALSNYRGGRPAATDSTSSGRDSDMRPSARERTHRVADSTRRGTHRAASSVRRVTHKAADSVRSLGHRAAQKSRDVTDRTNARFPARSKREYTNRDTPNPMGK